MKKIIFLISLIFSTLTLHSQNFAIKIVPKIKNDSLYIAYVLTFQNFPTLTPTLGQVRIVTELTEAYLDLDKGVIRKVSRYDISNPTSGTHFLGAQLLHDGPDRSTYLITRNPNILLTPYYLANVNFDTLGIVSYPMKRCFNTMDIKFDTKGSLETEIRTWAMNDVASGVNLVDFQNKPIPKENTALELSEDKLCSGGLLHLQTNAIGTNFELSVVRNGSTISRKTSNIPEFKNLKAGIDFINNDRFFISYRSRLGCLDSTVTKSIAVGNCCDSSYNSIEDEYCIAGFSKKLIPVTPGGTFTGGGVHYDTGLATWIFSPKAAGPGTHTITYTTPTNTSGACKGQSSAQDVIVNPVPCKATISNVLSNLTIPSPNGIFTNCDGEIFIASSDKHVIYKIDTFGVKTVYAGDTIPALAKDGDINDPIVANRPIFCQPIGLVGNLNGDLFLADGGTQSIIKVSKTGQVLTIGGFLRDIPVTCGTNPSLSTYGTRGTSRFNDVYGVALNATEDTLFVSESKGNKISGIELITGTYKTFLVAGTGSTSNPPVNGSSSTATFKAPQHISVSGSYLYIADNGNNMIRRVDLKNKTVITLAGKFKLPSDPKSRINVDTSQALLDQPSAVTADCEGNAYVVEPGNNWVLRINRENNTMMVTRFAGDPFGQTGDTYNTFNTPQALSIYTKGFIDVADYKNNRIVRLAIDDWSVNVFRDVDSVYCKSTIKDTLIPVKCSGSLTCLEDPSMISTVTVNGTQAYTFTPSKAGTFTLSYTYVSGRCTQSLTRRVKVVEGLKPDLGKDLSFCDQSLKIDVKGGTFKSYEWKRDNVGAGVPTTQSFLTVTQVSGTSTLISVTTTDEFGCVFSDDIKVSKASASFPSVDIQSTLTEICSGQSANLFAAFTPSTDAPKYLKSWNTNNPGDTTVQLVANKSYKYVFTIADKDSPNCTKSFEKNITLKDAPQPCYRITNSASGLEIPMERYTVSTLPNMVGITKPLDVVYRNDDLYIAVADANQNHKIIKYNLKTAVSTDYVGIGAPGFTDGLAPLQTKLNTPSSIAFDSKGNMIICNLGGNYISKYNVSTNVVDIIAGSPGVPGFNDGEGQAALFNKPTHIEIDAFDNVYVTDNLNNAIRKLSPIAGKTAYKVSTYTGLSGQQGAVDGKPKVAKFDYPWGIAMTNKGLVLSEDLNHTLRYIDLDTVATLYSGQFKASGHAPTVLDEDPIAIGDARYDKPWGLIANNQGVVFVADGNNNAIKKVTAQGVVNIAGQGAGNEGNTDGDAYIASFNKPTAIAATPNFKTLYVSDRDNNTIRKIKRADTMFVCASDFVDNMIYENLCQSGSTKSTWYYEKTATVDSLITSLTSNGGIQVSKPGLYINVIEDNVGGCTPYRDSLWFFPKATVKFTTDPVLETSSIFCFDQDLTLKLVSNPELTNSTYSLVVPRLSSTPIVGSTPTFTIKLDKKKLTANTSLQIIPVQFVFNVKDAEGCRYTHPGSFKVNNMFDMVPIVGDTICAGDTVVFSTYDKKGYGYRNRSFTWKPADVAFDPKNIPILNSLTGDSLMSGVAKISARTSTKVTVVEQLLLPSFNPKGCRDSVTFDLVVKPAPMLVATPDTGLCGGTSTSIVLKASLLPPANEGPYKFTWYNLASVADSTVADSKTVAPTVTTKYAVVVSTNNGCKVTDTTTVGVGVPPIATIELPSKDTTVCPLDSILLRGKGVGGMPYVHDPKYRYEWRNIDDDVILSNNNPYQWTADKSIHLRLQVKDSIGCSSTDEVTITVNSFKIEGGQKDTTICQGTSFTATPVKATGSTSYTYAWDQQVPLLDDPTVVSPVLSPTDTTKATIYVLEVKDNFGCKLTDEVSVSVGTKPKVMIATANDFCQGQEYLVRSTISGGQQPYRFVWTEPQGQDLGFAPSDSAVVEFKPNKPGSSYVISLKAIDANKCESNGDSHLLQIYPGPYLNFATDTVLCNGKFVTQSADFPENAGLNLDFEWYKDNVQLSNTTSTQVLDAAGVYKALLTSEMGCKAMDSIAVFMKDSIESINLRSSGSICKGQEIKLFVDITKGSPDFDITWGSDGAGTLLEPTEHSTSTFMDSTVYRSATADNDSISMRVQVSNSCNILRDSIKLGLNPMPTAVITSPTSPNAYVNQPIEFTQGSSNYDALAWDFGDATGLLQSNDIKVSHVYTDGNVFKVILWAETNKGCKDSDTLQVPVINNQNIFIPNVFNPSSVNPENSNVKVYGVNISNSGFSFVVFNRWGQVVFETRDYSQATKSGWNGKMNNTGEDLTLGSYTYLLKGKYGDGKEFEKVGTITLVK